MRHPSRPGELLEWEWVIDYFHASEYIHKLSQALFRDPRRAQSWAWKMCRWLKTRPRAIYRVLHSAAAIRSRRSVLGRSKAYREAYGYLRDHSKHLDYVSYRRNHLPIGSGVTEAACKTVFSQRLKRSGMAWSVEGGQRIVDLRVIDLSGVWSEVHQSYLQSKRLPEERTQDGIGEERPQKSRIIPGMGAIAPIHPGQRTGTVQLAPRAPRRLRGERSESRLRLEGTDGRRAGEIHPQLRRVGRLGGRILPGLLSELCRSREIGTAGFNGFTQDQGNRDEVRFVNGSRSSHCDAVNRPSIINYIIRDARVDPAGKVGEQSPWVVLFSKACWIIWLLIVAAILGVGYGVWLLPLGFEVKLAFELVWCRHPGDDPLQIVRWGESPRSHLKGLSSGNGER